MGHVIDKIHLHFRYLLLPQDGEDGITKTKINTNRSPPEVAIEAVILASISEFFCGKDNLDLTRVVDHFLTENRHLVSIGWYRNLFVT